MKTHRVGTFGAMLAVLALAGCGASITAVTDDLYADSAGTASKALADGKQLGASGPTNASVRANWKNQTSQLASTEVGLKKNAGGGMDMTVDGEMTSFASTDRTGNSGFRKEDNTKIREIYSWTTGNVDDDLSPDSKYYSQLWEYFAFNKDTEEEKSGFVAVGTETRPEALGTAKATYTGYTAIRAYDKSAPGTQVMMQAGTSTAGQGSSLTMNADFGAGKISGEANGFVGRSRVGQGQWTQFQPLSGKLVFEEASIVGNSYEGKISGTDALDVGANSTYGGRFFGPAAEETAGTIEIDTPGAVGRGGFRAFKQ